MDKLLLVTNNFSPMVGGVARYYQSIAGELPQVVVVTSVPGEETAQVSRRTFTWALWPRWLPLVWKVGAWQRNVGARLTAAGQLLPVGTALWLRHVFLGQPYLVFVHGLDVIRGTRNVWKRFLTHQVLGHARLVVANSAFTKSLAERAGSVSKHTVVVHPSFSLQITAQPSAVENLRKWFNLSGKLVLLTVARLVKRKGIERVLGLLPDLVREFPNLTYVVLGSGPEGEALRRMATNHNLPVLFPGAVGDEALAAWYELCDVFVLAPEADPQDAEGFGIVYLEAQAAGKPVVASRVGGVPEAVGEAGMLVESDVELFQACRRLLKDQAERQRLGALGKLRVTKFTPAAQAAKLKELLYGV